MEVVFEINPLTHLGWKLVPNSKLEFDEKTKNYGLVLVLHEILICVFKFHATKWQNGILLLLVLVREKTIEKSD